jgi:DNA-binding NarL/FixJ family response regulator
MQHSSESGPKAPTATVIADSCGHFRETLRRVLVQERESAIIYEAATLREALHVVRNNGAGVALIDVDLVMNQPAARLRRIVAALPGLRVVVMLNEDLPGYRRAIAERWGYDCIVKESAVAEIPTVLYGRAPHRAASR